MINEHEEAIHRCYVCGLEEDKCDNKCELPLYLCSGCAHIGGILVTDEEALSMLPIPYVDLGLEEKVGEDVMLPYEEYEDLGLEEMND